MQNTLLSFLSENPAYEIFRYFIYKYTEVLFDFMLNSKYHCRTKKLENIYQFFPNSFNHLKANLPFQEWLERYLT
jgi:hypothetical protein